MIIVATENHDRLLQGDTPYGAYRIRVTQDGRATVEHWEWREPTTPPRPARRGCGGCGGEKFDDAVRNDPAALEQLLRDHHA
jgi:hypothetical protein